MSGRGSERELVVIESPFGAGTREQIDLNIAYARRAMRDSLDRGEVPIASHLLYTQPGILRDEDESERALGIECGFAWGQHAKTIAFYVDRGWSRGMIAALTHWTQRDKPFGIAIREIGSSA